MLPVYRGGTDDSMEEEGERVMMYSLAIKRGVLLFFPHPPSLAPSPFPSLPDEDYHAHRHLEGRVGNGDASYVVNNRCFPV